MPRSITPIPTRLERLSRRDGTCLLWVGHCTPTGYGVMKIKRRSFGAHRIAYEAWVGPLDEGLEVDHLCGVRNCIEPTHLEAVTRRENVLRSASPAAKYATQDRCIRGHEFDESKNGRRHCRACVRERRRLARSGSAA